jgi:hypothetical protein
LFSVSALLLEVCRFVLGGSNPPASIALPTLMWGFEPEKGLGKEFSQVVGVTGVSSANDARGAEPLWKFAKGGFGF